MQTLLLPHPQRSEGFTAYLHLPEGEGSHPLVIFLHGFKGFADWGANALVAETFAKAGFAFIRLNFSHNGTTPTQPTDFADLEAFGQNNFEKEIEDIDILFDFLKKGNYPLDLSRVALLGHSRGGGLAYVYAVEHSQRFKAVLSWAAVPCLATRYAPATPPPNWEKDGVRYIPNARTNQQMPLYFQFYENTKQNFERFRGESSLKKIKIPAFAAHGTDDLAVEFCSLAEMKKWQPQLNTLEVADGNHTFGATHPWTQPQLPKPLAEVVKKTIAFAQKYLSE